MGKFLLHKFKMKIFIKKLYKIDSHEKHCYLFEMNKSFIFALIIEIYIILHMNDANVI